MIPFQYFFSVIILVQFIGNTAFSQHTLEVSFENITNTKGVVRVAVYSGQADFLQDGQSIREQAVSLADKNKNEVRCVFNDLATGEYAVAIYHDENNNGELDTGLFGIPSEAYGFSNNARSKWGPPKYSEARFTINRSRIFQSIALKKWRKQ